MDKPSLDNSTETVNDATDTLKDKNSEYKTAISDTTPSTPPAVDISSIYPTPVDREKIVIEELPDSSKGSRNIVLEVVLTLIGLCVIAAPFVPFIWISQFAGDYSSSQNSTEGLQRMLLNPVTIIMAVVSTLTGIGIILRKELARLVLIFLTLISLCTLTFGLFTSTQIAGAQDGHLLAQQSERPIPEELKRGASAAQEQERRETNAIRNSELAAGSNRAKQNQTNKIVMVVGILVNIALLIFITRPGVKRSFK